MAAPAPVYWVGNDGNVYLKSPQTDQSGGWSTTSVGSAANYNLSPTGFQAKTPTDPTNNPLVTANQIANPSNAASTTTANPNTAPDTAIASQASNALTTAQQALQSSNAQVQAEEGQQENELDSNKASQENTFNNTLTKNNQGLTDAETGARTQGNTDLTSLDRLIASLGGGGSSVETEEIPALVGRSVAGNIAGADTTKATNDQAANVAWNTFLDQLGSQKQQLQDQTNEQIATNQGAYAKTAAAINQIISAANGGTISPSDLSYELESTIGAIPNVVNWTPQFSGTTPVYTTPSLSNFTLTPSQISAAAGTALPTSGSATIPFLAALTGNQQKQTAPTAA